MGATIDYGILYTNYYLESRRTMGVKAALIADRSKKEGPQIKQTTPPIHEIGWEVFMSWLLVILHCGVKA